MQILKFLTTPLWDTATNDALDVTQLRGQVITLLSPFREPRRLNRTAMMREEMTAQGPVLRALLSALIDLPFCASADHPSLAGYSE